jgi:hypothetical protein
MQIEMKGCDRDKIRIVTDSHISLKSKYGSADFTWERFSPAAREELERIALEAQRLMERVWALMEAK